MKAFAKKTLAAAAMLALLLLLPQAALAADVSTQADSASVQAGDTVEIAITVTGDKLSIAEGSFTYDPAVLTYEESDGGASDGLLNLVSAERGGADTLVARIRFTAAGAGTANVAASISRVLGYDGEEQSGGDSSVSITVAAADATPSPTPLNYAAEGVAAQNVKDATEPLYIWKSLENVTIPSRYSITELTYHGETVAAAAVEDSDAPTLLYLSNAAGDSGAYYIYNAAADTLYRYQTVSSVSKSYILLEPDGSVPLPDGFSETTLTIGETAYTAWQSAGSDLYLVYARNPDGDTGYYYYNAADESLQRYAVLPAQPIQPTRPADGVNTPATQPAEPTAAPEETAQDGIRINPILFYIVIGLCVLLLVGVVLLFVSRASERRRRKQYAAQRRRDLERLHELDGNG